MVVVAVMVVEVVDVLISLEEDRMDMLVWMEAFNRQHSKHPNFRHSHTSAVGRTLRFGTTLSFYN